MKTINYIKKSKWIPIIVVITAALLAGGGIIYANLGGGSNAQTSSSAVNLSQGLVGWWKFNGNAKDSTPYGHNGTLVNAPSLVADRKGQPNSAYDFRGSPTDSIDVTDPYVSYWSKTYSFWVKIHDSSNCRGPLFYTGGSGGYGLFAGGADCSNPSTFNFLAQQRYWLNTGSGWTVNAWTHVVVEMIQSGCCSVEWKLYLNGNLASDYSGQTPPINGGNGTLYIGSEGDGDNLNKSIDDFRVYNRTLNTSEITALYNTYDPGIKEATTQATLTGWWKFNGNAKDSTPYSNNGTTSNVTLTADREGQPNNAFSFNGTSSSVQLPAAPFGNYPTSSCTSSYNLSFSAWFKTATNGPILGQTAGGYVPAIYIDTTGHVRAQMFWDGSQSHQLVSAGTYTDNKWHLVTDTYNAGTQTLYVDGSLIGSNSFSQCSYAGAYNYYVGYATGSGWTGFSSSYFSGSIDDVRVYGRALNQTEVSSLYQSYDANIAISTLQKGLLGYWDFNGNAKDKSPNGNNGTVNSGATLTTDRKGQPNSAYSFTGSGTSYVTIPPLNGGTQSVLNFSINAWIYPNITEPGAAGIVFSRDSTAPVGIDDNGSHHLGYVWNNNGSSTWGWDSGLAIPVNQWSMVSLTITSTGATLYLYNPLTNTLSSATNSITHISQTLATQWVVASDFAGGRNFGGIIDDVRIYNRTLTSLEIQALTQEYQ